MAPPPVSIYVTSLTSAPKVRKHIELLRRALGGFEIPYEEFDLATDEEAKKRWQRAKPLGQVIGLPGFLVGGDFIGTMDDFEEAVEMGYLEKFLRQDHDMAETSQTIGEDELDKLMREMSGADLDSLVDDLSVHDIDESELANLGASTPPSRSAELPSSSSSTSGLFSAGAGAGVGAAGAAATAAAISASPGDVVKDEAVGGTPTKVAAPDARGTPTKADPPTPTKETKPRDGILAGVGAAVSELAEKASEAVHGVEEKLEGLAKEPASVAAAKEELEEGSSPVAETRAEPPVTSSSTAATDLVAANKAEVASPGPLPNEPTLDQLIDTTLAKESIAADAKEDAADAEAAAEKKRLLAETKQSEAEIHALDSKGSAAPAPTQEEAGAELAAKEKAATASASAQVEGAIHAADAQGRNPITEPTLDALIDKTMAQEHAQYEAEQAQEAKAAAVADAQTSEQSVHTADVAAALKKTE